MNSDFKAYLLEATQATECEEVEIIQSLWSGYGKIIRYGLQGCSRKTVVVKSISLKETGSHPYGWTGEISHKRKVKSYEIERNWYQDWSSACNLDCRVPEFIGFFAQGKDEYIIMEDLDAEFPIRKASVNLEELKACLSWLANFHARFMQESPKGLWKEGTYWHLDTRPEELESIEDLELKNKAPKIDALLRECHHQTILHGDAKLANFCFSKNGREVAAVDFQYVGGGCGMKDLAYFLGSCLPESDLFELEEDLLNFYFQELKMALRRLNENRNGSLLDFDELEGEWRRMYPLAWADFLRFLLGWKPNHEKINSFSLEKLKAVLETI